MCCIRPGRAPLLQRCNNHMSISHLSERLLRGQFEEITFFSRHRCKKTRAPTLGRLSQSSFSGRGRKNTVAGDVVRCGPMKGTFLSVCYSDMASNSTQQHEVIYEQCFGGEAVVPFLLLWSAVSP